MPDMVSLTDRHDDAATLTTQALKHELDAIAQWWCSNSVDKDRDGFYGQIGNANESIAEADQSVIQIARILWFFATLARETKIKRHLSMANRAFFVLKEKFLDPEDGGLIWSIDAGGNATDSKKQTYAQAFGIYAFTAYYNLTDNSDALDISVNLLRFIENSCADRQVGGYLETCSNSRKASVDHRLSEFDLDAPKTMNTHLHVMEAYALLCEAHHTTETEAALRHSILLMLEKIYNTDTKHLGLFFEMDWTSASGAVSFGHEVEACWLMWWACEVLGDVGITERARPICLRLAYGCLEQAMAPDGYLYNEREPGGALDERSIWWVQAEGLVGMLLAYRLSGEAAFFHAAADIWRHIQNNHVDRQYGEWFWLPADQTPITGRQYKAGMWKGPYHNGRAMLESIRLLSAGCAASDAPVFTGPTSDKRYLS